MIENTLSITFEEYFNFDNPTRLLLRKLKILSLYSSNFRKIICCIIKLPNSSLINLSIFFMISNINVF